MRKCFLSSTWRSFKMTINLSNVALAFMGFDDEAVSLFLTSTNQCVWFVQSPSLQSDNIFNEALTESFNATLRPALCIITFTFE